MPERMLDLGHQGLRSLPAWIFDHDELEILYVHDNPLGELPALERLDLRWTGVQEAPAGLRERGCVVWI